MRPGADEAPVDDVNWFARPVRHDGTDRIVAFASHNQNYLYNLTAGVRVRIPDRSDAVATPDGRYMTVPSSYTPDANVRFYPMAPLLRGLAAGDDVDGIEPAFIHEHPSMKRVYYQSTGVIAEQTTAAGHIVDYRLMFSGGADESNFRIVDYRFTHDKLSGDLLSATPSSPMALCPAVRNDLNTPFISKDAQHVAAYTSDSAENSYSPGASLKIFEITATNPDAGTTSCRQVADFGFAAGKADFSFDGTMLTIHISQGDYLTPFINGGLPSSTITDVVVAQLEVDRDGQITGPGALRRLTTSLEAGIGSYFPAFFPDGTVFYVANTVHRDSETEKRFHFRVADARPGPWHENLFDTEEHRAGWQMIESMWETACAVRHPGLVAEPFPLMVPLRDRCNFGRSSWLISQALSVTYVPGEHRLYLERSCRPPENPATADSGMARGLAVPKGLNSRQQFGPAVERRRKSRPRSTGFHGSSPCKCQRLSTLRSSWLPPSRPPTKSGAAQAAVD